MGYTNNSIDKIRTVDIVTTIDNCWPLKKQGANYVAKSPWNQQEKTASFVVSPVKQMFSCFSTGIAAGDGIKFVMLFKNLEFIEAVEFIAKIHSISLEKENHSPEQQRKNDEKTEMYTLTETISRGYVQGYRKLENKHWAKKIIAEREFTEETLLNFQIGFASFENKVTDYVINKGLVGTAKDLGLINTKDSRTYDFFKERIVFPIHNDKGTVIAFGGRRSNDEKVSKYPKYLNSKASVIYDKSKVLYGLYQAKSRITKTGVVILTEGYTDVMAMHQRNCENTVASCGTALTTDHAALLKKYAKQVILLRDSDKAGINAMLGKDKDLDIFLRFGFRVDICMLPDGEDPDTFSRTQLDIDTWIDANKKDALLYKSNSFDFKPTRYDDEVSALKDSLKVQIKVLEDSLTDTEELEGNELTKAKEDNKAILDDIKSVKAEIKSEIAAIPKIDQYKKAEAVKELAYSLYQIRDETIRIEYIKQISKIINVTVASLKAEIGKYEVKANEKTTTSNELSLKNVKIPEGATKEEYLEGHGFVSTAEGYHFHAANGQFIHGTNFYFQPLFHIQGDKENKRICEITNNRGKKKLIDFDSGMLANFNEFKKYLFRIGGFMFLTHNGIRVEHFDRFVYRYEQQFEPALELLTLGWNKKGFFAFANGVYWDGQFRPTNKYGIINLKGIDQVVKNEYNQQIDNFYSPAFSVMYEDMQDGDDDYENDRYFVYKESPVSLEEWMDQFILVFGDRALFGILFCFSAMFRDLYLSAYDFFPLLGGFGEKDSGKSGFGKIIQNFFYYRLPPLDLTQATHVGFSRRLKRNANTVQFCDEYQDRNCKEEVFNGLMGAWNGIGREKGKGVGTNRTSLDKINSAVYYCGQFVPTRMENALATRTISMQFQNKNKSNENFTLKEKDNYSKLINWGNTGLSSLTSRILEHRNYFKEQLNRVHPEAQRELKSMLKDEQYQERVFGNVSVLYSTFLILKDKIKMPVEFMKLKDLCVQTILENSELITDSNALTEFWNIVGWLFENTQVKEGSEFIVNKKGSFKIKENRSDVIYTNSNGDEILYIRMKSLYQYYNKEATKREGVDVLGDVTIKGYFKSQGYFIGLVTSMRFGKGGSSSAYAFNYTKMKEKGIVYLDKDAISTDDSSGGSFGNDPAPVIPNELT